MTESTDRPKADEVEAAKRVLASALDLPPDEAEGLMMADDDLDTLCDAVLSRFVEPTKKVSGRGV